MLHLRAITQPEHYSKAVLYYFIQASIYLIKIDEVEYALFTAISYIDALHFLYWVLTNVLLYRPCADI
jgi:hypothetical protein